jgi:hypothetical protein
LKLSSSDTEIYEVEAIIESPGSGSDLVVGMQRIRRTHDGIRRDHDDDGPSEPGGHCRLSGYFRIELEP